MKSLSIFALLAISLSRKMSKDYHNSEDHRSYTKVPGIISNPQPIDPCVYTFCTQGYICENGSCVAKNQILNNELSNNFNNVIRASNKQCLNGICVLKDIDNIYHVETNPQGQHCQPKCENGRVCRANKCFDQRTCVDNNQCLVGDICYLNNCVTLQNNSPKQTINQDICSNIVCNKNQKCVDGQCVQDTTVYKDEDYCSVQVCQQNYGCNPSEGCYPLLDPYHQRGYVPSKTVCRINCGSGYLCKQKKCVLDHDCKANLECRNGQQCKNGKCQKRQYSHLIKGSLYDSGISNVKEDNPRRWSDISYHGNTILK